LEYLPNLVWGIVCCPVKVKDWGLLMQRRFAPDRVTFTLDLPLCSISLPKQ